MIINIFEAYYAIVEMLKQIKRNLNQNSYDTEY